MGVLVLAQQVDELPAGQRGKAVQRQCPFTALVRGGKDVGMPAAQSISVVEIKHGAGKGGDGKGNRQNGHYTASFCQKQFDRNRCVLHRFIIVRSPCQSNRFLLFFALKAFRWWWIRTLWMEKLCNLLFFGGINCGIHQLNLEQIVKITQKTSGKVVKRPIDKRQKE